MSEFGQLELMNWFEHQVNDLYGRNNYPYPTAMQPSLSDQEEDQIKSWLCIPSDPNEADATLTEGHDLSNKLQTTVGLNDYNSTMPGIVEVVVPSSSTVIKRNDVGLVSEEKDGTSHAAKGKEKKKISKEKKRSRSRCDQAVELGSSGKKREIVDTRSISPKKLRPPAVHRVTERKRRDKINEKMKELQELLPRCKNLDKASTLDKAIGYMKDLQMQVQMMYSCGYNMSMQMYPQMPQPCMPPMSMLTNINNPAIQVIPSNMNPGRMCLQGAGMIPVNLPFQHNMASAAMFPFPDQSGHPSTTFPFVMPGNFRM